MKNFLIQAALLLATGMTLGALVWNAQILPEGVHPVVWDKENCAECGMSVSTHGFAAQLQTSDGRVLNFDDPGCLLLYVLNNQPPVRALYFHAMEGEEWLGRDEVAFAPTKHSPMGYSLGAVPRGTPGALTFEQALEKMRREKGD